MSHQKTCKPKHKHEPKHKPCYDSSSSEDECDRLPLPPACKPDHCNPCKGSDNNGSSILLQYSSGPNYLTQNATNYIAFGSTDFTPGGGANVPDSYSTPLAIPITIKTINFRLVTQTVNVILPPTIPTLMINLSGLSGTTYTPVASTVGTLTVYTFSVKNLCIKAPAGTLLSVSVINVPVNCSIAGSIGGSGSGGSTSSGNS